MSRRDAEDLEAASDLIAEGARVLSAADIEGARFEAKIILAHILATKPSRVVINADPLAPDSISRFRELVSKRASRVPLQYVIGTHDFMGLMLACRPGVFVPRPETEVLVETVLGSLRPGRDRPTVADVGCGSGAIAVAVAHHLPGAAVHAVDISADAVRLTAENARRLGLAHGVRVYEGHLLDPLVAAGVADELDAIVANLPYIPSGKIDGLAPEISKHEPREALDGGPDGLMYFRKLVSQIEALPPRRRLVALEVGLGQARQVARLLQSGLECSAIETRRDHGGIERIVLGFIESQSH